MLKACSNGAVRFIFSVNNLYSLYAGAFRQFTTGWIGWSGLWIFISSLMNGTDVFILMYFHLHSFGIRVGLCFIVSLIWVWNALVGSVLLVRNCCYIESFVTWSCIGGRAVSL
jgi:hypothetical protein